MKVVFLYTELADYIRNCFESLAKQGHEVFVVAYPVNPEAPFRFEVESSLVRYCNRSEFDVPKLFKLIEGIHPDALFCSGWVDSGYNEVLKRSKEMTNRVLISDNALDGSLRAFLSLIRSRFLFRDLYDVAFVPGPSQKKYAEWMGFPSNLIYEGFYSADVERFSKMQNANFERDFPRRFVFVGRYLPFKGIYELWDAFAELNDEDWALHCYGTGADWDKRAIHPRIFHHGFVQPTELDQIIRKGGIFVLPSLKEPWGVVVHEFAAAGFPLLLSERVNAASRFLEVGLNGFLFESGRKQAVKTAMKSIMQMSSEDLAAMAEKSRELARRITVADWIKTVELIAKKEQ